MAAFEPVHAVVYFDPGAWPPSTASDSAASGWATSPAGRAPFGAVGPEAVTATFFNFHPHRAARALPEAWSVVSPADVWATRRQSAASPCADGPGRWRPPPDACVPGLRALLDGVPDAGRPLFAATRATGEPDDPVEALWYWCTAPSASTGATATWRR